MHIYTKKPPEFSTEFLIFGHLISPAPGNNKWGVTKMSYQTNDCYIIHDTTIIFVLRMG